MEKSIELKAKIRQFIMDTTFSQPELVKNDTLIFIQGIFDSMGFISLCNFIEEAFAVKILDTDLLEENFESVNAISNFIESKLNLHN